MLSSSRPHTLKPPSHPPAPLTVVPGGGRAARQHGCVRTRAGRPRGHAGARGAGAHAAAGVNAVASAAMPGRCTMPLFCVCCYTRTPFVYLVHTHWPSAGLFYCTQHTYGSSMLPAVQNFLCKVSLFNVESNTFATALAACCPGCHTALTDCRPIPPQPLPPALPVRTAAAAAARRAAAAPLLRAPCRPCSGRMGGPFLWAVLASLTSAARWPPAHACPSSVQSDAACPPANLKSLSMAGAPLLRGGAFQLRRLVRSGLVHSARCSSLVCCRICSSSAACSGSLGSTRASNSRWWQRRRGDG